MSDKITSEITEIIKEAQNVGLKNGVHYIGTEEIVYGMLAVSDNFAKKILKEYGLDERNYYPYLQKTFRKKDNMNGFTPTARSINNLAVAIAKKQSENYFVSSEHLLLAILKTQDCLAMQIFRNMRLDVASMEKELEKRLSLMNKPSTENFKTQTNLVTGYSAPDLSEIENLGEDLTLKAYEGNLEKVIGRDNEINEIIRALARKTKNSPVLIGEPGVGKSAIVEGLAQEIVAGRVPDTLMNKTIFSFNLSSVISGTKYRGEFEEKFKKAIDIFQQNDVIVFIDEIHNLMGAGKTEGSINASEMLKPMLARGELRLIGATTYDEYAKFIEPDEAMKRRFQPIYVKAPTQDDAIKIIIGIKDKFEAFHRVEIKDEAVIEAVTLSERYFSDRQLPDKAIDLIDECAAQSKLQSRAPEKQMLALREKMSKLDVDLEHAYKISDEKRFNKLKSERISLENEMKALNEKRIAINSGKRPYIDAQDVAKLVSEKTGIPVARLTKEESERLLSLEKELHNRIIGQEEAVRAVSQVLKRARLGLNDGDKPLGSFIFVGSTGVGKTELSKALAEIMFGDEKLMIRIDMGEYSSREDVTKLIGSAPGYVGSDEEGYLTQRVRREPYSVVLFDEIEKAHPDVFNVLLQVLDEGRLTDNKGRTVDFKNTIIIMTSNLGIKAEVLSREEEDINISRALKTTFKPEFLNRVEEIVHFRRLSREECSLIVVKFLSKLQKNLAKKGIDAIFDKSCVIDVLNKGYSEEYGARPLKKVIDREIVNMLADRILNGDIKYGDKICLFASFGQIDFSIL